MGLRERTTTSFRYLLPESQGPRYFLDGLAKLLTVLERGLYSYVHLMKIRHRNNKQDKTYSLLTVGAATKRAAAIETRRPAIPSSSIGEWNLSLTFAERNRRSPR